MVNWEAIQKIQKLEKEYERTWGKKVDYSVVPIGIDQEKLVYALENRIKNNDSLLVAYNRNKEMIKCVSKKEICL